MSDETDNTPWTKSDKGWVAGVIAFAITLLLLIFLIAAFDSHGGSGGGSHHPAPGFDFPYWAF